MSSSPSRQHRRHPFPVAFRREVHEPSLRIAKQDAAFGQVLDLVLQGLLVPEPIAARYAPTVHGDRVLDPRARCDQAFAGLAEPRQPLAELGELGVGVGDGEQARRRHAAATAADRWRRSVIRTQSASGNRPRRSISTGNIPTARAGSTSNSGLSPT